MSAYEASRVDVLLTTNLATEPLDSSPGCATPSHKEHPVRHPTTTSLVVLMVFALASGCSSDAVAPPASDTSTVAGTAEPPLPADTPPPKVDDTAGPADAPTSGDAAIDLPATPGDDVVCDALDQLLGAGAYDTLDPAGLVALTGADLPLADCGFEMHSAPEMQWFMYGGTNPYRVRDLIVQAGFTQTSDWMVHDPETGKANDNYRMIVLERGDETVNIQHGPPVAPILPGIPIDDVRVNYMAN